MSHTPIIETIARLLRLAEGQGATPAEAANAAAHAARLMAANRIERADVDAHGHDSTPTTAEPIRTEADPLYIGAQAAVWIGQLAAGIALTQNCRVYWSRRNGLQRLVIIGRASDVAVTRYLFSYTRREIDRLCDEAVAQYLIENGRTPRNNFRMGAVQEVCSRLQDAQREAATAYARYHSNAVTSTALARVEADGTAVETYMRKTVPNLRTRYASATRLDQDAHEMGREAGRGIALNRGLESGRPVRELG